MWVASGIIEAGEVSSTISITLCKKGYDVHDSPAKHA